MIDVTKLDNTELIALHVSWRSHNTPAFVANIAEKHFQMQLDESDLKVTCLETVAACAAEIARRQRAGTL